MLRRRSLAVAALGLLLGALPIHPAGAACHIFTFDKDSYSVSESKSSVTLIVARDAAQADSSVEYRTVNGTAKSPQDYAKSSGTIAFSDDETQHAIQVSIANDKSDEPTEEFTVVLEAGSGCNGATFEYDSATVRIQDNDPLITLPTSSPTPTPTQTATKKPKPKPSTASPTPSPSASATTTPSPTPTTTSTPLAQAGDTDDGGIASGVVLAVVLITLVFGGIAAYWVRRRFLT